jgi:nuclear protein localization family protein 4
MSKLLSLDAPNIQDSRHAKPGEAHKRIELAQWLSDWHLIAFLGTTQLFSPVSIRLGLHVYSDFMISFRMI